MYFLRIVLDEFLGALVFGRPFFGVGTDNASHLGGTLCGALLVWILSDPASASRSGPSAWDLGVRLSFLFLTACVCHDWRGTPTFSTAEPLIFLSLSATTAVPFVFDALELRIAAFLFIFYSFLLLAPSTPLRPEKWLIVLSGVCTVILPVLGALATVLLHRSSPRREDSQENRPYRLGSLAFMAQALITTFARKTTRFPRGLLSFTTVGAHSP